ncbi:unnamed protein product [Caenorhabditis auriculariae]|uniref:C-type lectin domain-containing protein n=1 Tax=Caenorhabditis auriculariae TaxID=2777116 RepID=A0A8S1H0A9_9PELO|nr:unnamed protein product [Caenorhabditis auriculariae]
MVLNQQGVSFDWWTHVDNETTRYRSTIIAGSLQEIFRYNTFNDPLNDYEITTARQTEYDMGTIDAKYNYWGYPGTAGVASGKIRDHEDYPYLVKVDYHPVLESNTSLVEGDCPAGWFQAGHQEFKSCFLFVASTVTYGRAVEYCEELDAFVPYMRADDVRQKELARRIDQMSVQYVTDAERLAAYGVDNDIHVWISSVTVPVTQCAWLSARSGRIGSVNCNTLIPFVCEKGTQPYDEPIMWRTGIVIALVIVAILIGLLFLLAVCWWLKSSKRRTELAERKSIIRASMKLQKKAAEHDRRRPTPSNTHESAHASLDQTMISAYGPVEALPMKKHFGKDYRSPTETLRTDFSDTSDHTYTYTEVTPKGSDSYYTARNAQRHVSTKPNPYSEISTSAAESDVKLRHKSRLDTSQSTSEASCSTCPSESERTSTGTDFSSCTEQSTASESTVQNTRLSRPAPPRLSDSRGTFQPLPTEPIPTVRRVPAPRTQVPGHGAAYNPSLGAAPRSQPPGSAPPAPPTRSLVELFPPGAQPRQRTPSGRRYVVETSM